MTYFALTPSAYLSNGVQILPPLRESSKRAHFIPLFLSRVQAGFPSPTDEYCEGKIDLNEYLLPHKASTFFLRVTGDSMIEKGIFPGDTLIVDRSLAPSYGRLVVILFNGEIGVKRIEKLNNRILLCSENDCYPDIKVSNKDNFSIWGVVTALIHPLT